jgi:hypothetical protein
MELCLLRITDELSIRFEVSKFNIFCLMLEEHPTSETLYLCNICVRLETERFSFIKPDRVSK